MNPLIACMGGFCGKRDTCANYHTPHNKYQAERLCVKGEDGVPLERWIVIKPDDGRDSEVPA